MRNKKQENNYKKKKLDGLFCWIFLEEDDYIPYYIAEKFLESYAIIKDFMKDGFLDLDMLQHAKYNKHTLDCS